MSPLRHNGDGPADQWVFRVYLTAHDGDLHRVRVVLVVWTGSCGLVRVVQMQHQQVRNHGVPRV